MSDSSIHPVEKLDALLSQHAEVLREQSQVPERLAGAFDIALQGMAVQIESVLADASLLELKQQLFLQREADARTIEGLFARGLLNETQRVEQLEQLFKHPDYQPLRMIAVAERALTGTAGSSQKTIVNDSGELIVAPLESTAIIDGAESSSETLVATVSSPSVEMDGANSPETIVEQIPTELTIIELPDRTELKVGRSRGKRYRLSNRVQEHQHDYTRERELTLKILAEANGEEVTIQEIKELYAAEGLTVERDEMKNIRTWLSKIEFYGENLFIHNNKRGPSSAYQTNPKFDTSLHYKKVAARERQTTTEAKISKPVSKVAVVPLPEPETITTAIERGSIPLRESAVFMTFLENNADLLEALGITRPDSAMVAAIDDASYQEDIRTGVKRTTNLMPEELEKERINVAKQFKAVLANNELFEAFIDTIPSDDVLTPMIDYLMALDDMQWDTLLNQVLKATTSTIHRESSQGHLGVNPDKMITIIKLPNGKTFQRIIDTSSNGGNTFQEIVPPKLACNDDEDAASLLEPIPLPLRP